MISNQLFQDILRFRDERDWKQFHNPKDLALSLSLEASEILECFQWISAEQALERNKSKIADEIADVLTYALLLAHECGIDPESALRAKMLQNAAKYPVEKSKGKSTKYTEL